MQPALVRRSSRLFSLLMLWLVFYIIRHNHLVHSRLLTVWEVFVILAFLIWYDSDYAITNRVNANWLKVILTKLPGNDLRRRHTAVTAVTSTPTPRQPHQQQKPVNPNLSMSVVGDAANTSMASHMGDANSRNASPVLGQRPAMHGGQLLRSKCLKLKIIGNADIVVVVDLIKL